MQVSQICTGFNRLKPVYSSLYRFVLVHTDLQGYIQSTSSERSGGPPSSLGWGSVGAKNSVEQINYLMNILITLTLTLTMAKEVVFFLQVFTSFCRFVEVCNSLYRFLQVRTGSYRFLEVRCNYLAFFHECRHVRRLFCPLYRPVLAVSYHQAGYKHHLDICGII
jgi:hypothetical protein